MPDIIAFEIDSPIAPSGTGRFEIVGGRENDGYSFEPSIQNQYLVDSGFQNLIALFGRLYSEAAQSGTPEAFKQGISISAGAGQASYELQFDNPGQSQRPDGQVAQWGSSANPADGPNRHTATGASKEDQLGVLWEYLRTSTTDSLAPARLEAYPWSPAGFMPDDYLEVKVEQPTARLSNTSPSRFDASITFVETANLNEAGNAAENDGK